MTTTRLPALDPMTVGDIGTSSDGHVHFGHPYEPSLCEASVARLVSTVDWRMVDCKPCRWRAGETGA